jgi:beta-carotene hydroxylase
MHGVPMNRDLTILIDPSLVRPPKANLRNPTICVFAGALLVFGTSTALFFNGVIPRTAAAFVALVCLYCLYTVNHEAAHGNAHPNRHVNIWLGRISAALEGMTFPLFRAIHMQHHAHTNDPERDPDFIIGRQPRWLLPVWTVMRLTYDNLFMVRNRLWAGRPQHFREHLFTVAIQVAAVATGFAAGGFDFVLWGWIGPALVSGALLELTVAWAVHYPHESQHRLEHSRILHSKFLQVLTLNQNYHLVHHLWPRIPWFRYTRAAHAAESAVAQHRREMAASLHN